MIEKGSTHSLSIADGESRDGCLLYDPGLLSCQCNVYGGEMQIAGTRVYCSSPLLFSLHFSLGIMMWLLEEQPSSR